MNFQQVIAANWADGELSVQPRMGLDQPDGMREGLEAVRGARARTVGTITLDSFTRQGDFASVERALAEGRELNGYPIVNHGPERTRAVLEGVRSDSFPVQVRHGSPKPEQIFTTLRDCGIGATEGGPVSYCLPYSRTPLAEALVSWRRSADIAAEAGIHLETFGGCMLGQMCPPGLLLAISLLEALFFAQRGVRSLSLSFAQQTSFAQDVGALRALRKLASRHLRGVEWHLVLYTFMGVFPRTAEGAQDLLRASVDLAREGVAERLIVKTVAEAHRIPTVRENVEALELAAAHWRSSATAARHTPGAEADLHQGLLFEEASSLVEAAVNLHADVGEALRLAFRKGYLDVPFCLHRDNAGRTRALIDTDGTLQWHRVGSLPIRPARLADDGAPPNPHRFLQMLSVNERRFDAPHLRPTDGVKAPRVHHEPVTIAVVGGGPRGLSVVERLGIELGDFSERAVRVVLIDDTEPGAGRIWRTAQGPEFLMNTVTGQVTLYSGPPDGGPARPGHGPSLHEWLRDHPDPALARSDANTYAPRRVYGEYLRDVRHTLGREWPRPHALESLCARVSDVVPQGDRFVLRFEGQHRPLVVDALVLSTGHATALPGPEEAGWLEFCRSSGRCRYQPGDAAADLDLGRIGPGERVGVIGLGLGFHDILAELTAGRGGRFVADGDGLVYVPSGREPRIVAGSRSGLPIPARAVNQKTGGHRAVPRFFDRAAVERARSAALEARGSRSLSFRQDLYPLIRAEMEYAYYTAWARRLYGEAAASAFDRDHASLRDTRVNLPEKLLRRHGLADVPHLDLEALARPFRGTHFPGPEAFRRAWREYLVRDLGEARLGNVESPPKAALDVLRDVRDTLRWAVEFDGLTAASFEGEFSREFAPLAALLSAGPPASRVSQLLAIEAAGILTVLGPDLEVSCDRAGDCFRMCSPRVPGQEDAVAVLIDSRVPFPSLDRSRNPLLRAMHGRGLLRPYCRRAEKGSGAGGIDVWPGTFQVVGHNGRPNPRVFAIGLPSESPRWFTQVGSGTPGVVSRFLLDALAVGRGVLAAVRGAAREVARNREPVT